MLIRIAIVAAMLASNLAYAADRTQFGAALSDAVPVRIGELLSQPEDYVDKSIKVVGLVQDVCPMKGCWVEILEKQSKQTIRFKVRDDVIVFPVEARGQKIVAEGILRRHRMNEARARAWLKHLAEEKGQSFDESSHEGPLEFYQIEGRGAELSKD